MTYKTKIKLSEYHKEIEIEYVEHQFSPTDNTGLNIYDQYKISILLSDGLMVVTDDSVIRTETGDFLIFRPDEQHFGRILGAEEHRFLNIFIPTDYFEKFYLNTDKIQSMLTHINEPNCIRCHTETKEQLYQKLTPVVNLLKESDCNDTIEFYIKILDIILLLEEMYSNNTGRIIKSNIPDCVSKTLNYISNNFYKKISLKILAEYSFCSITYLSKMFKDNMGCTVYEYLTDYRINYSKKLLKEGKSVTEVCYECGFGDCSHFIRVFKEITGMTPHCYKKTG